MATKDDKGLFIDTNVLETPLHKQAWAAINAAHEAGRAIWISRQVIREYLVTLTRPQTFTTLPREMVLEQITRFIMCFEVADDTAAVTEQLVKLMANVQIGGKQAHDANIVASMLAYDIPCLLTHNVRDFERFGDVIKIERIDSN